CAPAQRRLISASSFARPSHPASVPQTTAQKPYRLTFLGISLSHLIDTYRYLALFALLGLESVGRWVPSGNAVVGHAACIGLAPSADDPRDQLANLLKGEGASATFATSR